MSLLPLGPAKSLIGISSAMVLTLKPLNVSRAAPSTKASLASSAGERIGDTWRFNVSNVPPRSI